MKERHATTSLKAFTPNGLIKLEKSVLLFESVQQCCCNLIPGRTI